MMPNVKWADAFLNGCSSFLEKAFGPIARPFLSGRQSNRIGRSACRHRPMKFLGMAHLPTPDFASPNPPLKEISVASTPQGKPEPTLLDQLRDAT